MKSPFAREESETYHYPEPFKKDDIQVDPEVLESVKGGEAAPWIKVRVPHSAADVDSVADYTQSIVALGSNGDGGALHQRIRMGNRGVFELLVEGWSFTDRKPTAADYDRLDGWTGAWIKACMGDVLSKSSLDFSKKEEPSSKPPESSPEPSPSGSEAE